ncbi:MAG TPA: hypothetical protein PK999_16905 [Nitrospira sp.]|nr:hypothetical protein [Nitrospira sp.]
MTVLTELFGEVGNISCVDAGGQGGSLLEEGWITKLLCHVEQGSFMAKCAGGPEVVFVLPIAMESG